MRAGTKIAIKETIPENPMFPEVPAGTPCFVAKFDRIDVKHDYLKDFTRIRIHSKYLGFICSEYLYIFANTANLKERA